MVSPPLDIDNVRKSAGEAVELAQALPRPINPFAYQGSIGLYENFKLLLGIVLVPIRIILALLLFVIAAGFAQLSIWSGKAYGEPRGTMQSMFMVPVAYIMRIVLFVWGFYWIPVKGKTPKPSEARMLVVASHSTVVDSLFIGYFFKMPAGISKEENKTLPLLGTVFKAQGAIFVDRDSATAKEDALAAMTDRVRQPGTEYFLAFPEGTCTNRRSLIQFKRGAFHPGVAVQPVVVRFPYTFFDPAWTAGGPSRVWMVFRLLSQFYNRMEVTLMPVIQPTNEEKENEELFSSNVRARMAEELRVTTSEHSYADSFLSKNFRTAKTDIQVLFPFEAVRLKKLGEAAPSLDAVKLLLKRFSRGKYNLKTGGMKTKDLMRSVVSLPAIEPVKVLCEILVGSTGVKEGDSIGFDMLVFALHGISRQVGTPDVIEQTFDFINSKSKKTLEVKDLFALAHNVSGISKENAKKTAESLFATLSKGRKEEVAVTNEQFHKVMATRPDLMFVLVWLCNQSPDDAAERGSVKRQSKRKSGKASKASKTKSKNKDTVMPHDGP